MGVIARFGLTNPSSGGDNKDIRTSFCTISEQVGHFVYLYDKSGDTDVVRIADCTDKQKMIAIGVIISKESDTICKVQWRGETPAIFSGLNPGARYFVGNNGDPIASSLTPTVGNYVLVQAIGVASDSGKIYINPEKWLMRKRG
jgi:hypothetical protein